MTRNVFAPHVPSNSTFAAVQFYNSIKKVKKESMNWAHEHNRSMEANLTIIEDILTTFSINYPQGFHNLEQKAYYMDL